MKISVKNTSHFSIKGKNATVVFDPPKIDAETADAVVITSESEVTDLTTDTVKYVISGPGEYEVSGVGIFGFAVPSDCGSVFVVELDGMSVCHLGDANAKLSSGVADSLGDIDVLLLPLAGDTSKAIELMNQIEPLIVVPFGADEKSIEALVKEIGSGEETEKVSTLTVTRTSLPQEMSLVLLK